MSRCPMVSRINALQFFFGSIQGDPAKRKKIIWALLLPNLFR